MSQKEQARLEPQTAGQSRRPGDLRAWLAAVERRNALTRVAGAEADLEIGRITEVNNGRRSPKALLFEDVPGRLGRVLTSAASSVITLAETLGLEASSTQALVAELRGGRLSRWFTEARNSPFEWVESGPVFENVETDRIDIRRFASPTWRSADGGAYIGTGCVVITRDPETGTYNGGAYRTMVASEREVTILMAGNSRHGKQHQIKWRERGERCPVVVSLGHDPLFNILAGFEVPEGVFELDVAGAVLGRPARMARGKITGLPIPIDAELVIEGWLTDKEHEEGPFGEFLGYYAGGARPAPVMAIEAVYYRDDPIILGSPPGKPPHDLSYYFSVLRSALLFDQIQAAGVPDVVNVWADELGGARMFIIVAIKQRYFGHSRQAGLVASQCQAAVYLGRYVVVVDEDVDPYDLKDVIWAIITRTDPVKDILVFENSLGSVADPLYATYEAGTTFSSRAIIDACRPYAVLDKFPPVAVSPAATLDEVSRKWAHLWNSIEQSGE